MIVAGSGIAPVVASGGGNVIELPGHVGDVVAEGQAVARMRTTAGDIIALRAPVGGTARAAFAAAGKFRAPGRCDRHHRAGRCESDRRGLRAGRNRSPRNRRNAGASFAGRCAAGRFRFPARPRHLCGAVSRQVADRIKAALQTDAVAAGFSPEVPVREVHVALDVDAQGNLDLVGSAKRRPDLIAGHAVLCDDRRRGAASDLVRAAADARMKLLERTAAETAPTNDDRPYADGSPDGSRRVRRGIAWNDSRLLRSPRSARGAARRMRRHARRKLCRKSAARGARLRSRRARLQVRCSTTCARLRRPSSSSGSSITSSSSRASRKTARCSTIPPAGGRVCDWEEFDRAYTGVCLTFSPGPDFKPSNEVPVDDQHPARAARGFVGSRALRHPRGPGARRPKHRFADVYEDVHRRSHSRQELSAGSFWIAVGIVGSIALQIVLLELQQHAIVRLQAKLALANASRMLWHVLHLPMTFFAQRSPAEVSNRVAICDRVAELLSSRLAASAIGVVAALFYLALMARYDRFLAAVSLGIAALNILALRIVARRRSDANAALLQEEAMLLGSSVSGLERIETLKSGGAESTFFMKWLGRQARVVNARQRFAVPSQVLNAVPRLLITINVTAILTLGGLRVIDGAISIGTLFAYALLMQLFHCAVSRRSSSWARTCKRWMATCGASRTSCAIRQRTGRARGARRAHSPRGRARAARRLLRL